MRALFKAAALALAVSLAVVPAAAPVAAFAQQAATTAPDSSVDLAPLLDASVQIFADLVLVIGGLVAVWLAATLKKKWGIDIEKNVTDLEANYRDTLHSAVETWAKGAAAKYGPNLKFNVGSPELAHVVNGIVKSAPDAVGYLKPTEEWVAQKAAGVLGVVAPVLP